MALLNENFLRLSKNYLFADIARRVNAYKVANPKARVISLGIGDVTQPLCPAVVEAMHKAVDEQATAEQFHGYGPEEGYAFLREAIVKNDYRARGIAVDPSEVFVSDGAKSDTGNIGDLLRWDNSVALTDPVYPVYIDSNVMAGRAGTLTDEGLWSSITYLPSTADNHFVPALPDYRVDVIYLCYPNNPTGTVLTHRELQRWVDYALANDTLLLYDAAYERYIQHDNIPHSIYEMRGAKKVAIEFRSFSQTAGFTGVRCGYTVVPKELTAVDCNDNTRHALNALWYRRQCTKFNGASYISQRAAEAIYSPAGREQVQQTIAYYMGNAKRMRSVLSAAGLTVYGGEDAPYLWVQTPRDTTSWKFFEAMLYGAQVVCTPGVGFGPSGEGYVRLTAFGNRNDCDEALYRITKWMKG